MQATVIGAGLAGCEAAWQLAEAGVRVLLVDMKPARCTPAQTSDSFGELVCSNSLRSANPNNAVGLLKEEMRRLGSLVIRCADATRVPAGDALAVDREQFAAAMTAAVCKHARIEVATETVERIPHEGETIVATGPLTDAALAEDIVRATGEGHLYFYDAIAPIVSGSSINRDIAFAASRYGKGSDYLNCPLDRDTYEALVDELVRAPCMPLHAFEEPKYFQGCLPIEVVAAHGRDALRYGTFKPVGLSDPRTGERAWAVVQLRKEDPHGQAYNLVGCQTKMKHAEQRRVFRMIPGLESAEFLRLGAVHRNTYIDSPALLDDRMRLHARPSARFAGQITGVEGYVESAAHGLIVALLLAADLRGQVRDPPPETTALGALWCHVLGNRRLAGRPHEPQNIHWGLLPPLPAGTRKRDRKTARVARARAALAAWLDVEPTARFSQAKPDPV